MTSLKSKRGLTRASSVAVALLALIVGLCSAWPQAASAETHTEREVMVQIAEASTTNSIELEITGTDESELGVDGGYYTVYARVKGADKVVVNVDGVDVEVQNLVNDGNWHDLTVRVYINGAGRHKVTIVAEDTVNVLFAEKILDVKYSGIKPPNTGMVKIGAVEVSQQGLGVTIALALAVLFVVILAKQKHRKATAKVTRQSKPIKR